MSSLRLTALTPRHRLSALSSILRAGFCRTRLAAALCAGGCFLSSASPATAQTNTFPSTGNVGIGTTSPGGSLDVRGSSSYFGSGQGYTYIMDDTLNFRNDVNGQSAGYINYKGYAGGFTQYRDLGIYNGRSGLIAHFQGSTGYVGIGTTNPGGSLDVRGPSSYFGSLQGQTYIRNDSLNFRNDANGQSAGYINYTGYAGGFTQYRDLGIYNGRSGLIAHFQGSTGNVGIGTTSPSHKLAVNGTIRAKEVIVDTGWSDYVFADDYRLAPLSEVEAHIKAVKHLPGIPSAAEVSQGGVSIGDMQARLLAKIEELTLHQIAQGKEIQSLKEQLRTLNQ